jgi:hypothetical protein
LQHNCHGLHQIVARRKDFAAPRKAGDVKRTSLEILRFQDNRSAFGVWFAGPLAQNPVAATRTSQRNSRAQFGLG